MVLVRLFLYSVHKLSWSFRNLIIVPQGLIQSKDVSSLALNFFLHLAARMQLSDMG